MRTRTVFSFQRTWLVLFAVTICSASSADFSRRAVEDGYVALLQGLKGQVSDSRKVDMIQTFYQRLEINIRDLLDQANGDEKALADPKLRRAEKQRRSAPLFSGRLYASV